MGDEEEEAVILSKELVSANLSQLARTVDGSSFAFVKVDVAGKELSDLGSALQDYPHLRYIDASKNRIRQLDAVVPLSGLLALNVQENAVESLPQFTNPYLQHIEAAHNQISTLEGVTGPAVTSLNVDGNKLRGLEGVAALEALERLDARQNEIASLQGLAGCAKLRELYVDENKLESLEGVEELGALQFLSAGGNQVPSLAPLEALTGLKELHLPGNAIEAWGEVKRLAAMKALRVLDLSDNPVTGEDGYRQELLIMLPRLVKIDGEKVTREELEEVRELVRERRAAAAAGEGEGEGEGED